MNVSASLFSKSSWIWPESLNWDIHNSYALFRKHFSLARVPRRAPVFITADQSYQLYVNGQYVCRGPARGFQSHWPYDEVDVRPFLREGGNVFAVRAHHPGFSNFQYLTQGYAGLLAAAPWANVVTDETWKCRRQTGLNRDTVPTSLQLFCQEHIDLREECPEWAELEFDDSEWPLRMESRPWNTMPWYALEARGIPMLEEKIVQASALLIGMAEGDCAKASRLTRDVARLRHGEGLLHGAADSTADEIVVAPTKRGRFRSYLLDFGRTVVGSVGFEISGARGGEIVDTLHVETIEPDTLTPQYEPDKGCRMAFGHRLICRSGHQVHTFYHAFGFRYMVVTVREAMAGLSVRPHLRTTLYPMEQNGGFVSSDNGLNRIWDACAWTQRVCSLDAYVDTPWREQAQWWGDARVQAWNTFFYSGDTRLFRRGIAQIAGQTLPNGLTYGHAPTMAHNCILPDFTLVWLITLDDYYWQTGSLEPFLTHQETVRKALGYFKENTDTKSGLVTNDNRYWLFLDWTGVFKDGAPTVYNLWLLLALDKLAGLYRKARQPQAAQELETWASALRQALARLITPDGLLRDGIDRKGRIVPSTSIHSQVLGLSVKLNGLNADSVDQRLLLPFIRGQIQPEAYPSAYWVTYVFALMIKRGHGTEVVNFIRDRWSAMADHGTTWENFTPRIADESRSHAWSAHPLYHLMQTVGGINQTAVAWKEIEFKPVFDGDHCRTDVPTPQGKIRSEWWRDKDGIRIELVLPPGVKARVLLPGLKPKLVCGRFTTRITQA